MLQLHLGILHEKKKTENRADNECLSDTSLAQGPEAVECTCVSMQPSIKNEDATISNIITIIITITVFMLPSGNCRKTKNRGLRGEVQMPPLI